jgi:DNA-binding NarL/FixJ family response regulator
MKVLLIDDHPLVLTALQLAIEGFGNGATVVGVAGAEAARTALQHHPEIDLVLLDLALGDADGFDVLRELRGLRPAVPVVVVSASEHAGDVIRAIDAGALGFVSKRAPHAELQEALGLVMGGAVYVPASMLGLDWGIPAVPSFSQGPAVPAREGRPSLSQALTLGPGPGRALPTAREIGLTPRQSEVLALLLQGLPNKLIARQLKLSVETVKDHVAAVLRALGVASRTQAVLAVGQRSQGLAGETARHRAAP